MHPSRPDRARRAAIALGPLLLAASLLAQAEQIVDVRDGMSVEALISLREPTRVRIDGFPIRDVFGNVQTGSCGTNPVSAASPPIGEGVSVAGAEVLVECDLDRGEIYLRPIGIPDKPINLFVASPHATYTLLLRAIDRPAATLVLRDRTRPTAGDADIAMRGAAANPIRRLKAMLVTMASDQAPGDIRIERVDRDVPLWADVRFTLQRRAEGRGVIGEQYVLQNLGSTEMVLTEPEFDREGANVGGVSIEHHNLRPGERTIVYVLRFGGRP